MIQIKDANYYKFTVVALLFLLLAFDRDLAMIYLLIMFGDFVWMLSDNFVSFPYSNGPADNVRVYIEAAAALGAFLGISTFMVSYLSPQSLVGTGFVSQTQSLFQLLATSTPILKGSPFLTFIGWGILVPVIETSFFFGRLLEGFTTYAEHFFNTKISLDHLSIKLLMVIFFVAALFTIFHFTSKEMKTVPLLITFIFAAISCLLVQRQKQLKGAISLHIGTNSAAVASALHWI